LSARGGEEIDTLPEAADILSRHISGSPFEWIGADLTELGYVPVGDIVDDIIQAMGITCFVCPGSGQLIDGEDARRGFAFGIGSARKGDTMTGRQVAEAIRGITSVLPATH